MSTLTTGSAETNSAPSDDTAIEAVTSPEIDRPSEGVDAASRNATTKAGGRHRHRRTSRRAGSPRVLIRIVGLPVRFVRMLRPSRLPWYGAVALGALLVAALVVDGLWWQSTRSHSAQNSARGDALVAATSAAQKVLSFDYRTINADVARAKATATGPFLRQYEQTSASLIKEVGPAKAIVQASVQSGSIVNASNGQITTLLFVDQASVRQDAGQKTPVTRIDQARVQMIMVKQHGRWLVYSLTSL